MADPDKLIDNILSDMEVELTEMFDRNFEKKRFFRSKKWPARKMPNRKGSLLVVTGKMRRSIRSKKIKGKGVNFSSSESYTAVHNDGGKIKQRVKAHSRKNYKKGTIHQVKEHDRTLTMPKRQFIGDHPQVKTAIKNIVHDNATEYFRDLAKKLKK